MSEQVYEQLTLFQEDFPASHFPWLESKKVKTTTVICGRKCSELSENLRRVGSSVRTYLESCELPLPTLYRTWSVKDMTSRCLILKLRLSERRTDEKELHLSQTEDQKLWLTTPVASDAFGVRSKRYMSKTPTVAEFVKLWATPTKAIAEGTTGGGNRRDLRNDVGGQLNPTWVEWLMGFPIGWTDLNASETP